MGSGSSQGTTKEASLESLSPDRVISEVHKLVDAPGSPPHPPLPAARRRTRIRPARQVRYSSVLLTNNMSLVFNSRGYPSSFMSPVQPQRAKLEKRFAATCFGKLTR